MFLHPFFIGKNMLHLHFWRQTLGVVLGAIILINTQSSCDTQPIDNKLATNKYATNFSIEPRDGYTLLTIPQAWKGATQPVQYALYPRTAPRPTVAHAICIPTPVERIVCTSTIQVAMLDFVGASDKIVGISDGKYLYNTAIKSQLETGKIADLGNDQAFNYEKVLTLAPDVVLIFGLDGASKTAQQLENLHIPTFYLAEFMETTPLGRAEWVRVVAALLGTEPAIATKFQQQIAQPYEQIKQRAQQTQRPSVLTGIAYEGTWYVAGGKSFLAQLVADAGGAYLWRDNAETGGVPMAFEAVYAQALAADVWLNVSEARDLATLRTFDPRYTEFTAFQRGRVFSYAKRVSPSGGYDIFESAVVQPHLVLQDLARIFQTAAPPEDSLFYYTRLR